MKKIIAILISFVLAWQQAGYAQSVSALPGGVSAATPSPTDVFRPLHLRYLACEGERLNLMFDRGSNPSVKGMEADAGKLVEYFLTGISLPNDVFWVNLRPDSSVNIIDDRLAQTDMGKVFLEADVQLKKDVSMATSPSTPQGRAYWDRLYKKAGEIYGTTQVDIPTLNRPWIVPGEVIMATSGNGAYIYKATLKVMLEQDYLAGGGRKAGDGLDDFAFTDSRQKELNAYSAQLMRELIIPAVTREVNSSRKYAALRQAYYSLIFAQWFKGRASAAARAGSYGRRVDSGDMSGIASTRPWDRMKYYEAYRQSFRDGEYDLRQSEGMNIRSYFSGGLQMTEIDATELSEPAGSDRAQIIEESPYLEQAETDPAGETSFSEAEGESPLGVSNPAEELASSLSADVDAGESIDNADNGATGDKGSKPPRKGGKLKRFFITTLVIAAIFAGMSLLSQLAPTTPTPTATYTAETTVAPTPTALPEADFITPGDSPEAFTYTTTKGLQFEFETQNDGQEAVLRYEGFAGGETMYSYETGCILSEGEYRERGDPHSYYTERADEMMRFVDYMLTSGVDFSVDQWNALEKLREALLKSIQAASAIRTPEIYDSFRSDLADGSYYVIREAGDEGNYIYILPNGDEKQMKVVMFDDGSIIIGGMVYTPGDEGYDAALAGITDQVNAAAGGTFSELWHLTEKRQGLLMQNLITDLGKLRDMPAPSATPAAGSDVSASPTASPTAARDGGQVEDKVGGIDLTAIPLLFRADTAGFLQRMGTFPVSLSGTTARERRSIARMVSRGMVPSMERVREFFAVCYQKNTLRRFSGDVLAWTAMILRQQEESAGETQPELRQMLAVVQNIR